PPPPSKLASLKRPVIGVALPKRCPKRQGRGIATELQNVLPSFFDGSPLSDHRNLTTVV
ncbi:hypothetical protein TorRG33x02_312330, partial [Trema orientale]